MHLDFANALNLVSTVTLIGALVFTGLQVRAANRARRDQAAVTMMFRLTREEGPDWRDDRS
jgi:hypothetical protein